jgi:drug/metabolite transporter (DMT)-like permease
MNKHSEGESTYEKMDVDD